MVGYASTIIVLEEGYPATKRKPSQGSRDLLAVSLSPTLRSALASPPFEERELDTREAAYQGKKLAEKKRKGA